MLWILYFEPVSVSYPNVLLVLDLAPDPTTRHIYGRIIGSWRARPKRLKSKQS